VTERHGVLLPAFLQRSPPLQVSVSLPSWDETGSPSPSKTPHNRVARQLPVFPECPSERSDPTPLQVFLGRSAPRLPDQGSRYGVGGSSRTPRSIFGSSRADFSRREAFRSPSTRLPPEISLYSWIFRTLPSRPFSSRTTFPDVPSKSLPPM